MDKDWKELHDDPPDSWREKWNKRTMLTRCDTRELAEKWMLKHQKEYTAPLQCDLHIKDGYVVYIQKE